MRQPEMKLRRYVSAQLLVVELCVQFFLQKQTANEQQNQTETASATAEKTKAQRKTTQQIKRETTQIATDLDEQQPALKRVKQEPENAEAVSRAEANNRELRSDFVSGF